MSAAFENNSSSTQKASNNYFKRVLKYNWITENLPYFLFLALLAVIYISNGHKSDRTVKDIAKLETEIKELKFEYKTLKSEVMYKTEESQITKSVENIGLKTNKQLPLRLNPDSK